MVRREEKEEGGKKGGRNQTASTFQRVINDNGGTGSWGKRKSDWRRRGWGERVCIMGELAGARLAHVKKWEG